MNINNALFGEKKVNIEIKDGKIAAFSDTPLENALDACGKRVIPGLIDVHTHGCVGLDTMDADFEKMCAFYASHGTTSVLLTTMTMDYESLERVTAAATNFGGAQILGFHFEGPYISPKQKGAQNEAYIKAPNIEEYKRFKNVKMVTVAPEMAGSMEFIKEISKNQVVSLGHTACDYETALLAIENGAKCLTHTYNAMPPFHHRNAGPIGAAFEKNIYAQLIVDGFHISKPVVLATYKMFGAERVVLISDSIRPAGMPDGEYESGGLKVILKDGAARLTDGTIAGSTATLWDCVKTAVNFGIDFDDAVRMASTTPAEMLGINKGKVEIGYDADLLVIDDDMNIQNVIIAGEKYM